MPRLLQLLAKANLILQRARIEEIRYNLKRAKYDGRYGDHMSETPSAQRIDILCREFAEVSIELVAALQEELGEAASDLRPTIWSGRHGFKQSAESEGQFMIQVWRLLAPEVMVDFSLGHGSAERI